MNTRSRSVRLHTLGAEQCRTIYETALRLLTTAGYPLRHEEARTKLVDAGCTTDGELIFVPASVVERARETAPKEILIYQNCEAVICLGTQHYESYFSPGMGNVARIDSRTGQKRLTVAQDVVDTAKVVNALPEIDMVCGLTTISDCPAEHADLLETRLLLEHSQKPIHIWSANKENLELQLKMFAAAAGGEENFLAQPNMVAGACASTDPEAVDMALCLFERNIPTMYLASPILGVAAPVTMAGALAAGLAHTLFGLALSQVMRPGSRFIANLWVDMFDMGTMNCATSAPELALGTAAAADLLRWLDLPFGTHVGSTDAPAFDQQAAADFALQIQTAVLSGCGLSPLLGYVETMMSSQLECIVCADELISYARTVAAGVPLDAESLAEEVILETGLWGDYLDTSHTLRHFRECWRPQIMARTAYEPWQAAGAHDYGHRANETVLQILNGAPTSTVDPALLQELDAILQGKS